METMPSGGHHKKADPKMIKKIREGGKKAQEIARKTHEEHQTKDVPAAEKDLEDALKNI